MLSIPFPWNDSFDSVITPIATLVHTIFELCNVPYWNWIARVRENIHFWDLLSPWIIFPKGKVVHLKNWFFKAVSVFLLSGFWPCSKPSGGFLKKCPHCFEFHLIRGIWYTYLYVFQKVYSHSSIFKPKCYLDYGWLIPYH